MYPFTLLPKPLRTIEFYVLLALKDRELHAYAIKGRIHQLSLGSIDIKAPKLYPLISRLFDQGLVELIDVRGTNNGPKMRKIYTISSSGNIRLQEELTRLNHAVEVGKSLHILANPIDTDLQRVILEAGLETAS